MQHVGPGVWGGGSENIPEGMSHSILAPAHELPLGRCWKWAGWEGSASPGYHPPSWLGAAQRVGTTCLDSAPLALLDEKLERVVASWLVCESPLRGGQYLQCRENNSGHHPITDRPECYFLWGPGAEPVGAGPRGPGEFREAKVGAR